MILRLFLSFCVGLTFVTASHAAIEDQVSEFMLDNGMQVVVIEDHRAPVVVHMVWYRAGAADETPGVSGVAHFWNICYLRKPKTLRRANCPELWPRMAGPTTPLPVMITRPITNASRRTDYRS